MNSENSRMDRNVFAQQTFAEADDHTTYWKDKSPGERLRAAFELTNRVYGTTNEKRLDRTVFSMNKHKK